MAPGSNFGGKSKLPGQTSGLLFGKGWGFRPDSQRVLLFMNLGRRQAPFQYEFDVFRCVSMQNSGQNSGQILVKSCQKKCVLQIFLKRELTSGLTFTLNGVNFQRTDRNPDPIFKNNAHPPGIRRIPPRCGVVLGQNGAKNWEGRTRELPHTPGMHPDAIIHIIHCKSMYTLYIIIFCKTHYIHYISIYYIHYLTRF